VDDGTSSVRLVHKSLQDIFERQHTLGTLFASGDGHPYIARTCLTYMGFYHDLNNALGRKYHLHSYVNKYWGHHVRNRPDNIGLEKRQILSSLLTFDESLDSAQTNPPWLTYWWNFQSREGLKSSVSDMIHYLAYFGLTDHIQYTLKNGYSKVDHIYCHDGCSGDTPLLRAAERGHLEAVRLLLEKGADIESQGSNCNTSLRLASRRGHAAVVQLLLEKGGNNESKDDGGWTPLCYAACYGYEPVVRLLVEKGANLEAKTNRGQTALSLAARAGRVEVVRYLIDKGAEIGSEDNARRTPLMLAAKNRYGDGDVMQLLLERGADPEAKDNTGCTAWDYIPMWSRLHYAIRNNKNHPLRILYREPAPDSASEYSEQQPQASP
jgi:hypothetical protein